MRFYITVVIGRVHINYPLVTTSNPEKKCLFLFRHIYKLL